MEKEKNYEYLLRLYSQVDDYLADTSGTQENLPEVVVAFCIITEKLFKLKLHKENPVLVYENTKLKENDALVSIVKEREINIETIKIGEVINRYKLMFENEFSDDEMQVLIDIYNARNHFIHGYQSDDKILSDEENIVKKMGTVWEKISAQGLSLFGKDLIKANKPKKKYSEEELEKVLIEEVRKKIQSTREEYGTSFGVTRGFAINNELPLTSRFSTYNSVLGFTGEECPRCGSYDFYLDEPNPNVFTLVYSSSRTFSDLYKCQRCNLELTKKEYEIAKKLKS